MSFLDIFKSAPAQQPTPAQAPAQQPANTQVQPGNMPENPNVTNTPATTPPATPEEKSNSPLDTHKALWDTVDKKDEPAAPVKLTEANLQTAMSKANFSKVITAEQMTAIATGGEDAAKALPEIMNAVVQAAMVQSTLINQGLTDKAVADAVAAQQGKIPELLRHQAITDHAKTTNPIFKDPAVIPVLDAVKAQLAVKHPAATPAEITDMTKDIMLGLGQAFTPEPTPDPSASTETDWSTFA